LQRNALSSDQIGLEGESEIADSDFKINKIKLKLSDIVNDFINLNSSFHGSGDQSLSNLFSIIEKNQREKNHKIEIEKNCISEIIKQFRDNLKAIKINAESQEFFGQDAVTIRELLETNTTDCPDQDDEKNMNIDFDILENPRILKALTDAILKNLEKQNSTGIKSQSLMTRLAFYSLIDESIWSDIRQKKQQTTAVQKIFERVMFSTDSEEEFDSNNVIHLLKSSKWPALAVTVDTVMLSVPGLDFMTGIAISIVFLAMVLSAHGFSNSETPLLKSLTKAAPSAISLMLFLAIANTLKIDTATVTFKTDQIARIAELFNWAQIQEDTKLLVDLAVDDITVGLRSSFENILNKIPGYPIIEKIRSFHNNYLPISFSMLYAIKLFAQNMGAYLAATQMSVRERVDEFLSFVSDSVEIKPEVKRFLGRLKLGKEHLKADRLMQAISIPDQFGLSNPQNIIQILKNLFAKPETAKYLTKYDPTTAQELVFQVIASLEGEKISQSPNLNKAKSSRMGGYREKKRFPRKRG